MTRRIRPSDALLWRPILRRQSFFLLRTALILSACAALSLAAACGGIPAARPKTGNAAEIVLIAKSQYGDFWGAVRDGARIAAREYGVRLSFQAPEDEAEAAGQAALIRSALASGADALLVAPIEEATVAAALGGSTGRSVPVFAVDSPVDSPLIQSFIGPDHVKAGRMAGEWLAERIGRRGRVGIVMPRSPSRNELDRLSGFADAAAPLSGIETFPLRFSDDGAPRPACPPLKNIDGIVVFDADRAVAAAACVRDAALAGRVAIVAFDSSPELLELLQEGVVGATIVYSPFGMGYLAVRQAALAMRGRAVTPSVAVDLYLVETENMFSPEHQKLLFPFIK
ncbi:MAG: hypothetical protein BLM47_06765 [Candidatus Reconcilbacillus cellulovorans]|uniref:Periplasmic binding protein domain-containing protein n=1 Tax=Candidatus Reconcilbacillus cellulovorans TaxID=1906605 RepID=A0A2A6E0C7_9BACL|nr:MAG: hypothetical protein BLM47_06765 [Candidatus Reconcilbacillus cellulovorans]